MIDEREPKTHKNSCLVVLTVLTCCMYLLVYKEDITHVWFVYSLYVYIKRVSHKNDIT